MVFTLADTIFLRKEVNNTKINNSGATNGSRKIYAPLGASNHTTTEREKDEFYATDPKALEMLLQLETFSNDVWECACGKGHLSEVLKENGHNVKSSDLVDRGYAGTEIKDFLHTTSADIADGKRWDIITNPPYKYAQEFAEHALDISKDGTKIAMFLKVQFLEGKSRKMLFEKHPPKAVYVSSSRLRCAKNADFENTGSSAVAYCWFLWEKGYKGDTVVKWFN